MEINVNGTTLAFSNTGVVLENGKPSKDWEPVFCDDGDNKDLYAYHNKKTNDCYDMKGKKVELDDEDKIGI